MVSSTDALDLPLDPKLFAWPISGMIADLRVAIKGEANFLAALGLLVFTEVLGRWIHEGREGEGAPIKNAGAFRIFYEEYMGRAAGSGRRAWGVYRGGLVHRHAFGTTPHTMISMTPDPDRIEEGEAIEVAPNGTLTRFRVNA